MKQKIVIFFLVTTYFNVFSQTKIEGIYCSVDNSENSGFFVLKMDSNNTFTFEYYYDLSNIRANGMWSYIAKNKILLKITEESECLYQRWERKKDIVIKIRGTDELLFLSTTRKYDFILRKEDNCECKMGNTFESKIITNKCD
jgi:hypothetical protein